MLDYQSFICKKCGKAVLRTMDTKYCQYCGAKLPELKFEKIEQFVNPISYEDFKDIPELKEMPKIVCPMCHGTGKVEAQAVQPFNPTSPYFNVMTNTEQKDK